MAVHTSLIGPIGESTVMTELLWHGWAPVNLNAFVRQAPNVDILAAKGSRKVALQIKTASPSSPAMLQLGHHHEGSSIFNSKDGPKADFIVFVRLFEDPGHRHECYIVPIAVAEKAAAETADDWNATPKRDGSIRAKNFPHCIRFEPNKNRPNVSNYKERWHHFLNAWQVLEQVT